MTGNIKRVWLTAAAVLAMGWGVVAQDGVDEDSLLALEEMTLTDAVEGDLPVAEAGDDDLLAELLAGGDELGVEEIPADDAFSLDELELDESLGDDIGAMLDDIPTDDLSTAIEGIPELPGTLEASDPVEEVVEPVADVPVADELDLEAAVSELGLPADEPEVSVAATPLDDIADVIAPVESDEALDDLLGDLAGEEPTAETPALEEKGMGLESPLVLDIPEVPADPEDGLADLLTDVAPETAAPVEAPMADEPDLDGLIDELADTPEPDLDLGSLIEEVVEPAAVVEAPAAVDPVPELVEEPAPTAPVEIVEDPEPEAYVDSMALDDDLFESLVNEAKGDMAAGEAALAEDAGEAPVSLPAELQAPSPVDDLVSAVESDMGLAPATADRMPLPPSFDGDPVAVEAEPSIEVADLTVDEVPPAPVVVPLSGKAAEVAAFETAERLRRIAGEAHGIESIQNAEKALAARDYLRAIGLFEEALKYLPPRAEFQPMHQRARNGLGGAFYLRALSLERMNELDKALAAARNAVKFGYMRGEGAVRRIQETIEAPPPKPEPEPVNRWDMKDFTSVENEVAEWMKRGRQAYLTGEYDRAILSFESVLARDPEHKEAIRLMRSAAQKKYDRSSAETEATRTRMIADVRDTWNPRQYGLHESPIDSKMGLATDTSTENVQRTKIIQKMELIRIPEVDFRQANIRDVVDFLHGQSVEFDPSEDPDERKGVNIILKLDKEAGGGAAPAEPLDPFAPDDAFGGGAVAGGGDETLVTFSALDITLKEALDIVVDVSGLKYRIRGSVVIILPKNAAEGEIEHRMYDVLSTAITRLEDLSRAVNSDRRGSGDFIGIDDPAGGVGGDEVDLKAFFTEMGVEWPDRSSIKFVRGLGKLVVANTLENLTVFEKVLSILNVVPYQIEIEARFVEVAQTDVDSLGLEWLLNDNWELLENSSTANNPVNARQRIVMNANSQNGGFTTGNRFLSTAGVGANTIADDILSLSGVLTNPEMSVVLHALQQRGHTDLLSAPKITTQSGQQATIKVVTEYIYPTEFETSGIGGSSNNNNNNGGNNNANGPVGAVVTPGSFETREVGVILEVMPEVSPEGQMINLTLSPEVVSEPTWKNYGSSYTSYDPNGNAVVQELNMEQPFFHTRHLRTTLLIYNGATVVMGGMITEVRRDVDDKIPILGDIPLIGRLFRSRYESSEKRNLLIFVTARLVDPSGRALDRSKFGVDKSIAEKLVPTDGSSD
jgi:general secretion pathway protein D